MNKIFFHGFAIYFCLLLALFSLESQAARWAIVSKDKAVIYSDVTKKSAIGYISKGKKIRVGDVVKNKLLAVLIKNKIAYIEQSDIQIGEKAQAEKSLEEISNRVIMKMNKKTELKRLSLFYGTYYGVLAQNDFEESFDNDLLFFGGGLRGYSTNLENNSGYRIGLEHMVTSKNDMTLSYSAIIYGHDFLGLKTKYYDWNFYLGPVIIPFAEFAIGDDFSITGNGLGGEIAAEMRFSIGGNLSFHIDGSYQMIRFFNMELPSNSLYPEKFDPYINGVKVLGVLSLAY
ncbi:MAG: hypothetical protein HON90_09590 [Halobacteriovoraceae bacterium]|jgi:hypothetical protein|nr:hypothetical protein [Halobacteriovoraceae bacterium]